MEAYLNVVSAVFSVAFVAWLLRELVLSQKSKESVPESERLRMVVQLRACYAEKTLNLLFVADSLQDMQEHLNHVTFASILTARVYYKSQVVYVMNKAGVLVAV